MTTKHALVIVAIALTVSGALQACCAAEMPVGPAATAGTLNAIQQYFDQSTSSQVDAQVLHSLQDILVKDPNNGRAHFLMGIAYLHLGLTGLSEEQFGIADKLAPNMPTDVLERFTQKVNRGDVHAAMHDYHYVLDRFPDEPIMMIMEAQLARVRGADKDVDWFVDRALEVVPHEFGLATAAGLLRFSQHHVQEAFFLAREDLARQPDYYRANALAGQACMQMHDNEQGARYLRKAFALQPMEKAQDRDFAESLSGAGLWADALPPALAYMAQCTEENELAAAKAQVRGLLTHLTVNDRDNVVQAVDRSLQGTPWQVRLHLALGDVFDQMGSFNEARAEYYKGLQLNPSVTRACYRLALDEMRLGKYWLAGKLIQQAAQASPKDRQIEISSKRIEERGKNHTNDLAWQLKDWVGKGAK